MGFVTEIDEGPEIIARCRGEETHSLPLKVLADVVVQHDFSRDSFEQFIDEEKHRFVDQDVNAVVIAYVEQTPPPYMTALEAELSALENEALATLQRECDGRLRSRI